jgi:nucleotide-binding universal stress UspA family protein
MTKQQVVVGYDFSRPSDMAVQRALELVRVFPAQHTLHVVTVLQSDQSYQTAERVRVDLEDQLKQVFELNAPGVELDLHAHVRIGSPADEILDLARQVGADLIIVGSHNRGTLGRLLLGSVSEAVVDRAHCTVLVTRPKTYPDVELEPVEPIGEGEHHKPRELAHRYSYSSGIAQLRSNDWPIG